MQGASEKGIFGLKMLLVLFGIVGVPVILDGSQITRPQSTATLLAQEKGNGQGASTELKCKAYYINMDKSAERRDKTEKAFRPIFGDKLERVSAVDGRDENEASCQYTTYPIPDDRP
jgi:hypothetical protein